LARFALELSELKAKGFYMRFVFLLSVVLLGEVSMAQEEISRTQMFQGLSVSMLVEQAIAKDNPEVFLISYGRDSIEYIKGTAGSAEKIAQQMESKFFEFQNNPLSRLQFLESIKDATEKNAILAIVVKKFVSDREIWGTVTPTTETGEIGLRWTGLPLALSRIKDIKSLDIIIPKAEIQSRIVQILNSRSTREAIKSSRYNVLSAWRNSSEINVNQFTLEVLAAANNPQVSNRDQAQETLSVTGYKPTLAYPKALAKLALAPFVYIENIDVRAQRFYKQHGLLELVTPASIINYMKNNQLTEKVTDLKIPDRVRAIGKED
jgi:hypothetical protein